MNKPNATIQSILMHLVEETSIPSQTNLWPFIEAALKKSNSFSFHKDRIMTIDRKIKRRFLIPAVITLLVFFAVVFLSTTPMGKALAQSIFDFFWQDQDDVRPITTPTPASWMEEIPGVQQPIGTQPIDDPLVFYDTCGGYGMSARCTIQEIQNLVPFQVYQLAQIPEGLFFTGASGSSDIIWVTYGTQNYAGSLIIYEEPWTGSSDQSAFFDKSSFEVGASAEIHTIDINGITVEYVQGSYTHNIGDEVAVWDLDSSVQTLRWVDHNTLFTIRKIGSEPQMDISTLAELVGNLSTNTEMVGDAFRTVIKPESVYFNKTVEQVEQEAGYTLNLPSCFPGTLTLEGAYFGPDYSWPVVNYSIPYGQGLSVNQQPIPESGECDLCGFERGTAEDLASNKGIRIVGMDARIEEVQIGNVPGQYVIGNWRGSNVGWVWESNSFSPRHLRWQSDGMAYELILWRTIWNDKSFLIAIAESILENLENNSESYSQGPIPLDLSGMPAVLADEWAKPVKQAENEAGFTMHLPSQLPENLIQIGALYEPDHPYVEVFYWMKGDWTDGLRVVEQPIPDSGICDLCGYVKGELDTENTHWAVGMNAEIHDVQIGEINGQFIRGKWVYENNAAVWKTTEDMKRLRWQKNGMAFELIYQGLALDKKDLIAIAESIP